MLTTPKMPFIVGTIKGISQMKNSISSIQLIQATLADYPIIQNMARFYVYDLSRSCGFISMEWACPDDGLYESFDFKHYFEDKDRWAFLIRVDNELAGFVLLHKSGSIPEVEWVIGEFFVLAKFQGKGIGQNIADQVFKTFPGVWEISIIPENTEALAFWRKTISSFTGGKYTEEIKIVDYDKDQPKRYILNFHTKDHFQAFMASSIRQGAAKDIPQMVAMSYAKRRAYECVQPQFWKHAEGAEEAQTEWFALLMTKDISVFLVAEIQDQIVGFIRGQLENASEVYNPRGATLMIDDFSVESPDLWPAVGQQLLQELMVQAKQKGASQVVVVSGHHDEPKRQFLKSQGLRIASEWFVGGIE
jgi:predicted acetyltransferase